VYFLWPSEPSEEDTQRADIREQWAVRRSELWEPDSNRNMFMVLTGHDPRIWETTENRFSDYPSRVAESMSSEAYQGPIHKLVLQQKSKQNPGFNDYPAGGWLFTWTNLCIWLFDGMKKCIFFSFSHFQCVLINHVIWGVPISSKSSQNMIQGRFLVFPDIFSLWY
jgi:hypothetical protein